MAASCSAGEENAARWVVEGESSICFYRVFTQSRAPTLVNVLA